MPYCNRHWVEVTHPCLVQKAEEVPPSEILSCEIQNLIDDMFDLMSEERNGAGKRGVGIAAPQIGVMKRVILVDVEVNEKRQFLGKLEAFINPKIVKKSEQYILEKEGCFSVDPHIIGVVPRAEEITVQAYTREGEWIEKIFTGYTARIFQHEIDHLQGIRFPERVANIGKLHWVNQDEIPLYRQTWKNWERNCPLETWNKISQGQPYLIPTSCCE